MDKYVVITGAAGGIGQALVRCFAEAGYKVIGTDLAPYPQTIPGGYYVQADLRQMIVDEGYASEAFSKIRALIGSGALGALINNAAAQVLGTVEQLDRNAWHTTLDVNLLAPFFWAQAFLPELEASHGTLLNISSIHSRLTKPGFTAYATSKAALSGMTRAMAVELGTRVRINAIEPAAIDTPMLKAGFASNPSALMALHAHHPAGCIGQPEHLGQLAKLIVEFPGAFLNGSVIQFDGAISSRLHDPE